MTRLLALGADIGARMTHADALLPILARFVFAATLLQYFWVSGVTKLGDGVFGFLQVTAGGFGQIFPKAAEAVLWDVSQMSAFQTLVVLAGTWAEFILPLMIVLGLLTRLAAFGMIGFVIVQSLTDIFAHGAATGAWFDKASDSLILDQRAFWVFLLVL
ncbi:MAG: DoxX family membrane protein, partial [Primorskyibacter sp.]